MSIVVVGGGLAGLTLALAMQRGGRAVSVLEEAEESWGNGELLLTPAATSVCMRMGLLPMDAASDNTAADGCRRVKRGDLLDRLEAGLAAGTVRRGRRVIGLRKVSTGVVLEVMARDNAWNEGDLESAEESGPWAVVVAADRPFPQGPCVGDPHPPGPADGSSLPRSPLQTIPSSYVCGSVY